LTNIIDIIVGSVIILIKDFIAAMVANASPVFLRKGTPIDMGRKFLDGRRLLGDGKTFEGYFLGLFFGYTVATVESLLLNDYHFVIYGLAGALGALVGDTVSSFFKRRLGLERGAPLPIVDQLDFYVGAAVFMWFVGWRPRSIAYLLGGAVLIIILHRLTNYLAYRLHLKDVPW